MLSILHYTIVLMNVVSINSSWNTFDLLNAFCGGEGIQITLSALVDQQIWITTFSEMDYPKSTFLLLKK